MQDAKCLLLPTNADAVRDAIGELKCAPLLQGYRGKDKANLEALVQAVNAVIDYSQTNPVYELDINPLLAQVDGAVAVDALIQLGQQ